ncbi:MAG TPA: GNAT family N-acetyltransferase [Actinocrinis sp.]|nr:GNAT family N-acetyltransferase [Actinocrinis sp.]
MDVDAEIAGSFALLTDGRCVQIRAAQPSDWQAVHDFAAALGRASIYRRFFGYPKRPGKLLADAVCAPPAVREPRSRGSLLALLDGTVVGLAEWIRGKDPQEAEIAFAVADRLQGHGVATLLAEHLLDEANSAGIRRLTAITQAENRAMLDVFATLGIPVRKDWDHGTWTVNADLQLDAAEQVALLDAAARRERIADDASLRHLLTPSSIAVLGDPQDAATAAVLRNMRGFAGPVFVAGSDGADLPAQAKAELAVITSPPALAPQAVQVCARHGASAVIVTSVGFDDESGHALLEACRRAGVRLVGPGSLGVINTAARGGLNASLAPEPLTAGPVSVAVQSGGVGLAILRHLGRLGVGIGTFAAVGDKYDVSANDLLMHWESDPEVRLGLLHVESFGNPRKFARTARALSRRIPLLAVDPEQSPSQARTALYAQAGITAVPSVGALVCAATLLAHQPAPRGRTVAVLGNTRGMVSLTVQACIKAGLDVSMARNLTPAADAPSLNAAVTQAATSGACDAVLVALAPTVPGMQSDGLTHRVKGADVPLIAVLADQADTVTVLRGAHGVTVPSYNDPATAAAALAAAAAATAVRDRSEDPAPELDRVDREAARLVIESCLAATPRGRALYASERTALLEAFGIPPGHAVAGRDDRDTRRLTVTAWQDFVFGPLVTCTRDGDGGPQTTLLVPAGMSDLAALARRASSGPAGDHDVGRLVDLLARVAAMVDVLPQLASVRLDVRLVEDGAVRVMGGDVRVTPARRKDPYLRRLRRAPVE